MTKLFARVVLPLAAGGLLLAGCTSTEGGTASPAPAAAGSSSGAPSSGTPSTASLDPCELVTAADVASFGQFKPADKKDVGGAHACTYLKQLASASDESLSIGVAVRDSQGVDSATDVGGGTIQGNVNGRKAVQIPAPNPPKGCTLALAVGTSARVDVLVVYDDPAKACDMASQLGDKVEPKLPKG